MYIALTLAMCAVGTLLSVAIIMAASESYAARRERRAVAIVEWAARRVEITYLRAMRQANETKALTDTDLRKSHTWIMERAAKMGQAEGLNVRQAIGGEASLQAHSWVALARHL